MRSYLLQIRASKLILLMFSVAVLVALDLLYAFQGYSRSKGERSGPLLSSERVRINLGEVGVLQDLPFSLTLRNISGSSLEVVDLIPSCGCTSVKVDRHKLAISGSTLLTGLIKASPEVGPFRYSVTVATRPERSDPFRLEIAGERIGDVHADCDKVMLLPDARLRMPGTAEFTLSNRTALRHHIKYIGGLPAGVSFEPAVAEIAPNQIVRVAAKVSANTVLSNDGTAVFAVDNTLQRFSIKTEVRPVHPIRAEPPVVQLGIASKKALLNAGAINCVLSGSLIKEDTRVNVELPPYAYLESLECGEGWARCSFKFNDVLPKGALRGEVKFDSDDRQATFFVTLPFSGLIRD